MVQLIIIGKVKKDENKWDPGVSDGEILKAEMDGTKALSREVSVKSKSRCIRLS